MKRASPAVRPPLDALSEIGEIISQRAGLDLAKLCDGSLAKAVQKRAMSGAKTGTSSYLQLIRSSASEWLKLVEELVVNETWFFREVDAIQSMIRGWMTTHRSAKVPRKLSVLCLPCSTGEEPYTVAMCLLEAGLEPKDFVVEGIDISGSAIRQGAKGAYGIRSLRKVPLRIRQRYFVPMSSGKYEIHPRLRLSVRLRQGNLLDENSWRNGRRYDAIFCRNLFIYLNQSARLGALSRLEKWVTEEGTVFLGSAELYGITPSSWVTTDVEGVYGLRRKPSQLSPQSPAGNLASSRSLPGQRPPACASTVLASAGSIGIPLFSLNAFAERGSAENLAEAGRLANQGSLAEALELCAKELRHPNAGADAYYLMGLVRDAMGQSQEATESYRKAIYLAPNHYEALLHLALLKQKVGEVDEAKKLQARAKRVQQEKESPRP